MYLYIKASDFGDVQAKYNLGSCYGSGVGAQRDVWKASELYKKHPIYGTLTQNAV